MNNSPELLRLEQNLNSAVAVAHAHSIEIPGWREARAVVAEAEEVRRTLEPTPTPPPADVESVAEWIETTAAARTSWDERNKAAAEVIDRAHRKSMRCVLAFVPDLMALVCSGFDAAAGDFARLVNSAPHQVNGQTSAAEFELHGELLRTVDALGQLALRRAQLALAAGDEDVEIGNEGIWMVLAPNSQAMMFAIRAAVRTFGSLFPANIEEWQTISNLGLGMARPGEAAHRQQQFALATTFCAYGAEGGLVDHCFNDVIAELAGRDPGDRLHPKHPSEIGWSQPATVAY